jgi:hypothetical protein
MEETAVRAGTPWHLWVVGGLGTLWNAFGAYDYLMTKMRNTDYLASMAPGVDPNAMLAWVDAFPIWAQFGWGLGVWMGLLGCIMLLMRHRWAVPVLGVSFVGALIGLGYQIAMAPPMPGGLDEGAMAAMPFVIIGVALALFLYARAMRAKGLLR